MYTLQGKTRPTRHIRFPRQLTYAQCTLPAGGPHTRHPFTRHRQIWTDPTAPEKKGLLTQSKAHQLTDPRVRTQLLSWASQWSRGRKLSSWQWSTTRFTGPISPACDWYVQYLLMGPTEWSLTDPSEGYNLGGADLPHTHSPTFPTSCLPFSLVAPPGLYFNQVSLIKPKCWVLKNLCPPRGLFTTRPCTVAYIYA
jgi:hypothetical protein